MTYFGKEFFLEAQENYEEVLDLIFPDLPEVAKEALSNFKAMVKIEKHGKKYIITTTEMNDTLKVNTFENGGGIEESTAKVKCIVEGDTYTRLLEIPDASITFKLDYSDHKLVETITHSKWDGVCKRFYKAA